MTELEYLDMPVVSRYIQVGGEQLHYLQVGSENKLLLIFHGYGDEARRMLPFARYVAREYTCVFFDLPHHGKTTWNSGTCLQPADLLFVAQEMMNACSATSVSLLGYSLGSRLCLSLLEHRQLPVSRVVLLAPDGLAINPYYYFFTNTFLGESLFRSAITYPDAYLQMLDWMQAFRLIGKGQVRYVKSTLQKDGSRKLLSLVWPSLKKIIPSPEAVRKSVDERSIQMHVFVGKYDKLTPAEPISDYYKTIVNCKVHLMEKGHKVFDEDNMSTIAQTLL